MIKFKNLTPLVYSMKSRDFQFIERLFDLMLNYVKTNSELINTLSDAETLNGRFVELLAYTLGFQPKKKYNEKQLKAIVKIFPYLLRNKGTVNAVYAAVYALLKAENSKSIPQISFNIGQTTSAKNETESLSELILYIPDEIADTTLLKDVLTYIIPAGRTVKILSAAIHKNYLINTPVSIKNDISIGLYKTESFSSIVRPEALVNADKLPTGANAAVFYTTINTINNTAYGITADGTDFSADFTADSLTEFGSRALAGSKTPIIIKL